MTNKNGKSYAILVNTYDGFEDCWNPFFKLLSVYWPDCDGKLYLNTEKKEFSFPGLEIVSLKVAEGVDRRLTWSECLINALDSIEEEYVLYLQEDYFLESQVNNGLINEIFDLMKERDAIDCIHFLSTVGTGKEYLKEKEYTLYERDLAANYSISCQAAFWKKSVLKSYVNPKENGWRFELNGSKRAKKRKDKFYNLILNDNKNNLPIPYLMTGIVGGKWLGPEVKTLFDQHNIEMDFSIRGFKVPEKRNFFQKVVAKVKWTLGI